MIATRSLLLVNVGTRARLHSQVVFGNMKFLF